MSARDQRGQSTTLDSIPLSSGNKDNVHATDMQF